VTRYAVWMHFNEYPGDTRGCFLSEDRKVLVSSDRSALSEHVGHIDQRDSTRYEIVEFGTTHIEAS
jgi:hypothetical protein